MAIKNLQRKTHLFTNMGLPCQPHHPSQALGYRDLTTAAQAAWLLAGLSTHDDRFCYTARNTLAKSFAHCLRPRPSKTFSHSAPIDRNGDLNIFAVWTWLPGLKEAVPLLAVEPLLISD